MSTDPYIGRSFGNYQLTRKIGEGGMGSVYLGEHPLIGKRVALKILHADLLAEDEMISRFFTEAKAVCRIGHQNIVDILDFGKDPNGDTYFIMEYLEGQPLADALEKQGALSQERAVKIAVQTASALAASHALGIVHRDLKPENIFLTKRGGIEDFVKVLDFGIAKLTGDTGGSSHRTRAGVILGTPHYMSPEQCEGTGHIDHRADIYSLGIILYEMVAGTVPFDGKEMAQIMVKHLTAVPTALDKVRPDCPPALAAITARCLKKDPNQRFPDMLTLKEELQKILPGAMPDIREESGLIRLPENASHPTSDTLREEEPRTMMLVPEDGAAGRAERPVKPISSSSQQNELKTMMLDGTTSTDTAMPAPVATAPVPSPADSADIKTMMMDPGTAPTQLDDEEEPATNVIGDDDEDEDDEAVKTVMMDPDDRPVHAAAGTGPEQGIEDLKTMMLDQEAGPGAGVPESGPDAKTFMLDPGTHPAPPVGMAPTPGGAAYVAPAPSGGGGALGALVGALVGLVILAGGGAAYYMGFIPDFLDLRIGAHADVADDDDDDDDDDKGRDRDRDDDDDDKKTGGGGDDDDDDDDDKKADDDDDDKKGDDDDDDDDRKAGDHDDDDDDDKKGDEGDKADAGTKPADGDVKTDAGPKKPTPGDDGPADDGKKPTDDGKTVDDRKKPGSDGAPATAAPKKKKKPGTAAAGGTTGTAKKKKPGTAAASGTTGTAKKKKKKPADPGLLSPF